MYYLKWMYGVIIAFICMYIMCGAVYALEPVSGILYDGIDVSVYQGDIDFNAARDAGVEMVYIRACEGYEYIDPNFEENYEKAVNAGLKVGFYHYMTAENEDEAIEQARYFADIISDKSYELRPAMDYEEFGNLSYKEINETAIIYMEELERLSGVMPVIYSDTYNATDIWYEELSRYPLWVAEYDVISPRDNGKWNRWSGWQYTDRGHVDGIDDNVDLNKLTSDLLKDVGSKPESGYIEYEVKYGDTLWSIAERYGVTVEELAELNDIENVNVIYAGQILRISVVENAVIYTVKSGDTLWNIGKRYGVSVEDLVRWNGVENPNFIYVGEKIRIYL